MLFICVQVSCFSKTMLSQTASFVSWAIALLHQPWPFADFVAVFAKHPVSLLCCASLLGNWRPAEKVNFYVLWWNKKSVLCVPILKSPDVSTAKGHTGSCRCELEATLSASTFSQSSTWPNWLAAKVQFAFIHALRSPFCPRAAASTLHFLCQLRKTTSGLKARIN